ncbi:MAG TPA: BamA/TamA family outer membrane protein [Puia sp.]|nr:BamA/TamA family outer membrane protein [Puia sp.]
MPKIFAVILCCCWIIRLSAQNPTGTLVPPDKLVEDTSGQRDLIGIALQITHIHLKKPPHVSGKRVYWSLVPLGTTVPGGGNALITATTAGFYMGERSNTFLSTVTFSPSTNFKGEFTIPFHTNIWSSRNAWNYSGDYKVMIFPQFVWGLGGNTPPSGKELIRYTAVRIYQNALKKISGKPFLFGGIGYYMDYHINIRPMEDTLDLAKFARYSQGTAIHSNSFSSGMTFNLLYDSRNNLLNPLPGWYYNVIFRINPRFLGSDDLWYSLYGDVRKYISFNPRSQNVLAFWSYLWTTLGSNPPYLDLPAITWDAYQRSGRGFYPARYMGKTLWDLEAEYRRSITPDELLGFVVFGNMNAVSEPGTGEFAYLHAAAGAGLRVKFNKHSGTNFCVDVAASKGYWAVYLNLGEAF